MNKRYQIFISSTFEDLKPERVKVAHALQEMDTIPVGMEQFSAGDEEQWKIIARHIDQSDYYAERASLRSKASPRRMNGRLRSCTCGGVIVASRSRSNQAS